jgi:NADH:ubiquinone oxidoreductase subunit F (NADH-binding)
VTSICGLGQGAPIPVRSAFQHWPELFEKMPA